MSFLDNLLTLENPLERGEEVLRFPRTWRNSLPWNKKPFCYKAHQTQGGLYLILPHNKDGSLFLHYPKEEFAETKNFYYPYPSIGLFYVKQVLTKRDKDLSFASQVSRDTFHPETKTATQISVSYDVNSEAVPIGLHVQYTMLLHQTHYKKVSFEVSRDRVTGTISARGAHIGTNLNLPRKSSWLTNHDPSLENLVNLITEKELGPEQLFPLITDDYVELHTLH